MMRRFRSREQITLGKDELCLAVSQAIKASIKPVLKESLEEMIPEIIKILTVHGLVKPILKEQVSTSEIKKRWSKSRTSVIKACREKRLKLSGKRGKEFLFGINDVIEIFGAPYDK